MSADKITFTIDLDRSVVSLAQVQDLARAFAAVAPGSVRCDPGGMGVAFVENLSRQFAMNIGILKETGVTGLQPYKDTLHEVLSKSLFAATKCASDPNIEVTSAALANADAAMRLIILMDSAK